MLGFRCLMFQLTVGGVSRHTSAMHFWYCIRLPTPLQMDVPLSSQIFQIWTWLEQRKAWWRLSKGLSCKWTSVCVCAIGLSLFDWKCSNVKLKVYFWQFKTTFNWVSGKKKKNSTSDFMFRLQHKTTRIQLCC